MRWVGYARTLREIIPVPNNAVDKRPFKFLVVRLTNHISVLLGVLLFV